MSSLTTLERHAAAHRDTILADGVRHLGALMVERCCGRIGSTRRGATYPVLASLNDHQLQDIGLTRTDLADVTGLARDEDPTLVLEHRLQERRENAAPAASAHETC